MQFFDGRINRKTLILGAAIGMVILGIILTVLVVPLALIDIIVNGSERSRVFGWLYYPLLFPVLLYGAYFVTLLVRRIHDLGYPGVPWIMVIFLLQVIGRFFDLWFFNLAAFLIVGAIFVLPGQNMRNHFGAKPRPSFRLKDIKVNA